MKKMTIIGCLVIGLLIIANAGEARADYGVTYGYSGLNAEYRNAAAMDDWLERGQAVVLESPVFADGVRLMGQGGDDTGIPGLASAVYHFSIPGWARYLTIRIRYQDEQPDDGIAARLWIKSSDSAMRGEPGVGEEALLYGDTYILRSDRQSETITIPASGHVEKGMAEMHIVAGGNDCIDVRDISVAYLDTRPTITIVHRTRDDYWDLWPRQRYVYHYYYWGPLFWPRTAAIYECWSVPQRFYWVTWRPWFHLAMILPFTSHPWWEPRQYTVIYHDDLHQPVEARRAILRRHLKERHEQARIITHQATLVTRTTDRTPSNVPPRPSQERRSPQQTEPARFIEARVGRDQTRSPQPINAPASQKQAQRIPNQTPPAGTLEARFDKKQTQTPVPVNAAPSPKPEQRMTNQIPPARFIEARADRDQTQAPWKKEPSHADKGGERPVVFTQAKTVNSNLGSARQDAPSTRPSQEAWHNMPKDQARTPAAKQTPRANTAVREGAQAPTHNPPTQGREGNQGQPAQGLAKIGQGPQQQPQPGRAIQQTQPDHAGRQLQPDHKTPQEQSPGGTR